MNQNIRKFDTSAAFAAIGALLFWSIGPIFIKFLTGYLDMWTQNTLRYSVACLFWLPFLLADIKTKRLDHRIWRRALLPAVANITMQCFWATAFYYIGAAFVVLLTQSSVIWITVFSLIFFVSERPLVKSKRFWLGMTLSVIGVLGVLLGKEDFTADRTITGIIIALMTSIMWGVYTVSAKIAFKDIDSRTGFSVVSIYTVAGFWVLTLIFARPQDAVKMGLWPWACVVISGLLSIGFSHVLYYVTIKRIGATIPALVLLAQPFIVLAISFGVFGESLNPLQWLFGIVLLTGSGLAIWAQQHLSSG